MKYILNKKKSPIGQNFSKNNFRIYSIYFILLLVVLNGNLNGQNIVPIKVCDFPAELNETSGLVKIAPNKFVTHTDSGNEPKLFVFDSSGLVQRRIKVSNATNVDWEDMTMDTKGNLYIGDFGNNNNDRKDLRIYTVASPNTYTKDSTVAGITNFSYPDQKAFPPAVPLQNFDMEAFFWFNDSLYLFTKNRTNPYNGYTKCYQLPARSGTFVAKLVDSFYTGSGSFLNYSITGSAIYPNGNKMILLGYDKCWLFGNFNGRNFFKGMLNTLSFPSISQKEGIWFENAQNAWYSQENSILGTAGLYRFTIPPITPNSIKEYLKKNFKIYQNPSERLLCIEVSDEVAEPAMLLDIINVEGKVSLRGELEPQMVNKIDISSLQIGTYLIRINGRHAGKFIKE
jgi:hypothetical protein